MEKKNLNEMTVKELKVLAKEYNIVGRSDMRKAQLISCIEEAQNKTFKESENTMEENNNVIVAENNKAREINSKSKMDYIEKAEIGTIVAFADNNGKIRSAKIVNRSTANRKFKLETKMGKIYIVPFENVIWVKTSHRWPKGVFNQLKGNVDDAEKKE